MDATEAVGEGTTLNLSAESIAAELKQREEAIVGMLEALETAMEDLQADLDCQRKTRTELRTTLRNIRRAQGLRADGTPRKARAGKEEAK